MKKCRNEAGLYSLSSASVLLEKYKVNIKMYRKKYFSPNRARKATKFLKDCSNREIIAYFISIDRQRISGNSVKF